MDDPPPPLLNVHNSRSIRNKSKLEELLGCEGRDLDDSPNICNRDILLLSEKIRRENYGENGCRSLDKISQINAILQSLKTL